MGATFGQRLRGLRDELGLTMEELVTAFNRKFPDIPLDRSKISRPGDNQGRQAPPDPPA